MVRSILPDFLIKLQLSHTLTGDRTHGQQQRIQQIVADQIEVIRGPGMYVLRPLGKWSFLLHESPGFGIVMSDELCSFAH
jgi:hypothetical protein